MDFKGITFLCAAIIGTFLLASLAEKFGGKK
jgi:hypothetical protein